MKRKRKRKKRKEVRKARRSDGWLGEEHGREEWGEDDVHGQNRK